MGDDAGRKSFVLKGIGVSPGIVIGKAYLFDRFDAGVSFYRLRDRALVSEETSRFKAALKDMPKEHALIAGMFISGLLRCNLAQQAQHCQQDRAEGEK